MINCTWDGKLFELVLNGKKQGVYIRQMFTVVKINVKQLEIFIK